MYKLMLLLDCASEFDRRLIRGLFRYTRDNGAWQFFRVPVEMQHRDGGGRSVVELARNWGASAIVGRWLYEDTSVLASLGIPVVIQNYRERSREFSNLTGDYLGTGRNAARFFHDGGAVNYAYFGVKDVVWSEERKQGFEDAVASFGGKCHSLMVSGPEQQERRGVCAWLHSLPKPVSLFCCDDAYALFISESCRAEGLVVPDEISILGVDNDELLCGITDPEISSISLDVEDAGYILGKRIHAQILEGGRKPFSIVVKPGEVVERGSTPSSSVSDPYVKEVVDYIRGNYMKDISIDGIVAGFPLSRRSLEMRFKKEMAPMTMYRYLVYCRVEGLARLLVSSDAPVPELAVLAGFPDDGNLSRVFRRFKGCTPQEYRFRMNGSAR